MTDILKFFDILHQRQVQHNTCKMSQRKSPNTMGISTQSTQKTVVQILRSQVKFLGEQVNDQQEELQDLREKHNQDTQDKCQELDIKMKQQSLQQKRCIEQMQQHQNLFMEERGKQHGKFLEDCSKQYNRYIDDIVFSQDKFIAKGRRFQFKKIKRLKRIIVQNRRDLRLDQQKIQNLEERIKVLLKN